VLKKTVQGTRSRLIIKAPREAGKEAVEIKLWISPFPYQQKMISFDPSTSEGDFVEAEQAEEKWLFKDGGTTYEWISDMKDFLAQKICDQLSGRQGTIGLDEYEWLRRLSNS